MSVSLWKYDPDMCDGDYCCGDCDNCGKEPKCEEVESPIITKASPASLGIYENIDYAELANAVYVVLSFIDKCPDGGTSYLTTPDGTKLTTDWGYVCEGLETLKEYAISKWG